MDHENLDVYRISLEVVSNVGHLLKQSKSTHRVLRDQILRSSTSILLNIAEGSGKRSVADRKRYYEIARGSAMETAAALDAIVALGYAPASSLTTCKGLLRRVVAMLTRMTEPVGAIRESDAEYSIDMIPLEINETE